MPKIVLTTLLCFVYFNLFAQVESKFCEQVKALKSLIKKEHYSPKPINDSLSKGVHSLFLKSLDPDGEFFLQPDIELFKLDRFILDDYILDKDCSFIDNYIAIFENRIQESKGYIQELQDEDLDYSGKDSLYFDYQNRLSYFKNAKEAKRYWNKRIRYKIITRTLDEDSLVSNVKANFKVLEAKHKPKAIQNQLCLLDEMLAQNGGIENFVKEAFLNAMLTYQDPNSFFFNNTEKQLFENSLSSSELSFGVITNKNSNGEIVVAYITPGSAANINGLLEENDIILSLTSGDDILEAFCVSNNDIMAFTSDDAHNTIIYRVKKTDGSIHNVELTKSIVQVESNKTDSFIIDGEKKLGYIKILSFYTHSESFKGNGLAKDVAKELFKLLKVRIDGLIIDLRFNGGGSMREATDLLGMFVNRGPVSIVKYNTGETITIRDPKRGVIFNKPIVVMINSYSASATEYFAGTLQDYNRAVLVGTHTHGKASAQIILPLDENRDLGFGKLTVEKFYRITGESHQTIGLQPDIELPTLYSNIDIGEKYEPFALRNDTLTLDLKYQKANQYDLKTIAVNSQKRVNNSAVFEKIKHLNENLVSNYVRKKINYPLTIDAVHQDLDNYFKIWESYNQLFNFENSTSYGVVKTPISKYEKNLTFNPKNIEIAEDEIARDMYVTEAYNIMLDIIKMSTPD